MPDLTGEDVGGQQVVGGLVLLITEHTDRILLKAVTLAALSCPQASPWRASQKKILTLGVTADLQTCLAPNKVVIPVK